MEHQKWLYQAWRQGYGNKAARPGHSNHQLGKALDIYIGDPGIFDWLEANANKFGHIRRVNTLLGIHVPALVTPMELLAESNDA